eukprot:CAMPEP_0184291004 /NCGR_PEP_ID=MMETSP1049-20130417/3119_1 /TAXON_ID=77928 /ORGANISM="Proteomonas sulcata, Strain CCMP704" /LENGTH=359 /DNA_ID=CAMNT_0026598305 /DNA_START=60 /DNA_END=1139 /DNA_ORIENTATION=-
MTDDQRKKAEEAETAFMSKLNRSRADEKVMFNIDIAGRRIYEGPRAEEVPDQGAEAGTLHTPGAGPEAQGGQHLGPRKAKGPSVDLMGPTASQDMSLGAQYSRPQGEVSLLNESLTGRAREIYEMLRQQFSANKKDKDRGGTSRVQHYEEDDGPHSLGGQRLDGHEVTEHDLDTCGVDMPEGGSKDHSQQGLGLGGFVDDHSGDRGVCMSMHQPWASLVVHGIKQVEGRDWSTEHRGRLWIAATKRKPHPSEIDSVLADYEVLKEASGSLKPTFALPEDYPTSALLGCIDVVDCVSGEVLKEQAEVGEETTDCEFGFICDRPCRLTVLPHILGQPKLYDLDPILLSRAQKQLREVIPIA